MNLVTAPKRCVPLLLAVFIGLFGAPVWSATFVVNSTADAVDAQPGNGVCETAAGNGVCTLRAAIQESNRLAGADTIQVPAGTYVVTIPPTAVGDTTGSLDISDSVDIVGAGAASTIVDGGALDNVFASVGSSKTITISGLTIQNGSVPATRTGGGISARANNDMTLMDVIVRNNHAGEGGGIHNQGNLTLIRTVVEGNTAIRIVPGSIEFRRGGGIYHAFGTLTIRDSTIRNNTAISAGGVFNMGTAAIEGSTISGNTATNVSLNNGDGGGGVVNGGALGGTMTITNSTISENRANANYGGIFDANGTLTLNSVTVANNIADADADSVGSAGGLGLSFENGATAVMRNSIVAGNSGAANTPDCMSLNASALTSAGYNLVGNAGSAVDCALTPALGDQIGTMASPIAAGLQPLGNYGGPTFTQALMDLSPAIDAGDPMGCSDGVGALASDQRGSPRVMAGGTGSVRCDIGAYEVARPVANAGPDQRAAAGAAVTLDGSASTAPDGIATYMWTQLSGPSAALSGGDTASPSFTAPSSSGVLTFQLTVADAFGSTASDTVDVTVNAAPVANAGADQSVVAGAAVGLDGSASSDSDGSIVSYAWVQTSGTTVALTNADTATPNFTAPNVAGTLVFQLTVTDNDGATASDSVAVTVDVPVPSPTANIPPVAKAGKDKKVRAHSFVVLNGWKSFDPDGKIVRYRWVQTSGPKVRLHGDSWPWAGFVAPREDGWLTFQLTVTDNDGASSSDSVTIQIDGCVKPWYHRFYHGWHHRHDCR